MEYKTKYSRYTEILLPSEEPFSNYLVNESNSFSPISLINILIGTNNSGKSRLLRAFFSLKDYISYDIGRYNEKRFYDLFDLIQLEIEKLFYFNGYKDWNSFPEYIKSAVKIHHPISPSNPIYKVVESTLMYLITADERVATVPNRERGIAIINHTRKIGENFMKKFSDIMGEKIDGKRYYIPILRGMRPLDDKHTNLYRERTGNDYFDKNSLSENMQIFTGLELYQTLKEKLLGEPNERKLVREFENFLSINFFERKEVTLIPKEKSPKVVHIKIGNEPQYPIYKLGDGLQNLIICTFNIFMEKETRCLFFIEEPDMFMHPSLQRSFLEVLSKYDQHQYFITSHSNHFLDMTIDFANISVFHFSKHEDTQPQFHIRPSSPSDRQILLDLGVRNSSVFITNATIWVEGITDRLYLKAYMKKYIDELERSDSEKYRELGKLKEDYHYSFVEYQGTNLTHWSFDPDEKATKEIKASYVCAHAFLIADGDVATKGDRKQVYTDMLGDRFHLLGVKEIENLIPIEILRKVVAEKFKEYEGNIEHINYEDYAKLDTPIGQYLDSLLKAIPEGKTVFAAINKSKTKSEGSGTIKSKGTFCDDAIKFMQNSEWALTDELKAICEKIFDHIITQNKKS
jgi:AAA15 family ATPase/GTPase